MAVRVGILVALVILLTVGIVAAVRLWNGRKTEPQQKADLTLPGISFLVEGKEVNPLAGYISEMDVASMRDTITPVGTDGQLTMRIESFGQTVEEVRFEVFSLDGSETYQQKTLDSEVGEEVVLDVKKGLDKTEREAVLKVELRAGGQRVRYYTRLVRAAELSIGNCIAFAQDFHGKAFAKTNTEELEQYLEPGEESDNTTLQTVNIHSNSYHIQWGDLEPQKVTEPAWSIKESNTVYTSLQAKYRVSCQSESGEEIYNVSEFFRVRQSEGKMYLLDYERTMNQVFGGSKAVPDRYHFELGMTEEVPYLTNTEGSMLCFVQERELWSYNKEKNELAKVFGFAQGTDARTMNDEHSVRMIHMEDNGNITFAVYGYMNSGVHEGETGAAVYYYDASGKTVSEKVFIPSKESFGVTEYKLGRMTYYSEKQKNLYVLTDGVLYQIDVEEDSRKALAENLGAGQYVASEDGHLLAWQEDGDLNSAKKVRVMNFETEEVYEVEAGETEAVKPLGFVFDDFVCGFVNTSEAASSLTGEELGLMQRLEIRSVRNKVVKTYEQAGMYISGIEIENNMITVNRMTKNGETYSPANADYISNNEERKDVHVTQETFSTELKEKQRRLVFAESIEAAEPETAEVKQVVKEEPVTVNLEETEQSELYYVYGTGRLAAVYEEAAEAVRLAEELSGVVVSEKQTYVWEKGNRDLAYETDAEPFKRSENQTSLEACLEYLKRYEGKQLKLSGCTLSQIKYIINQGIPVIAITEGQHALLLTGYGMDTVAYVDPDSGERHTISDQEMEQMTAVGGNAFIGFIR